MHNLRISYFALLVCCLVSSTAWAYEEPGFTTAGKLDGVEYRLYCEYLVAETLVDNEADRNQASSIGFRRLFDYIRGENTLSAKIAMTAPVQQQAKGEKIAMTAPVQQSAADNGWTVAFVVPQKYNIDTVPQPTHPDVYIRQVPQSTRAVLRFSGRWTDKNVNTHKRELLNKLAQADVVPQGDVMVAFYNAPFALPFMRRNEVMVAIAQPPPALSQPSSCLEEKLPEESSQ